MNEDPLVVIGLDAVDYRLAKEWNCQNILLENHQKIETFSHTKDVPITAEVWPAIATGKLPDDNGQAGKRGSDWDGMMSIANTVGKRVLPKEWQFEVGRYLRAGKEVDAHYGPVDEDHLFEQGAVFNWPGVTPAKNWSRAHYWFMQSHDDNITDLEHLRIQSALTGQELGWAKSMTNTGIPIVGTRCHILDHLGHSFCQEESKYRESYKHVDSILGDFFDEYSGNIVIVSDHGMQVEWLEDDEPGNHSWSPIVSSTITGDLPCYVGEFRSWCEDKIPDVSVDNIWTNSSLGGTTTQQLEDLGYL